MNHGDIVQQVHAEQPPERTLPGALDFLLRLLLRLPVHEGAGLLLKPAGENIIDYDGQMVSAGRICYPDGQLYKVLTDVPTTNGPSWQDDGTVDTSRYLPVANEPQEPDKEPGEPMDILNVLRLISEQLDHIQVEQIQQREMLRTVGARKFPILRATDDAKLFGMTIFRKGQAVLTPEE